MARQFNHFQLDQRDNPMNKHVHKVVHTLCRRLVLTLSMGIRQHLAGGPHSEAQQRCSQNSEDGTAFMGKHNWYWAANTEDGEAVWDS